MNINILFGNFDLFAEAPNAIQKLRALVLNSAISGKLTSFDTQDEPATELLKKIRKRKSELIESKNIRRSDLPSIKSASVPQYGYPEHWVFPRLIECVDFQKGGKPESLADRGKHAYIDIRAFERNEIRQFSDDDKCVFSDENNLLLVCDGSRSGLVGYGKRGILGSTLAKIDDFNLIERKYLFYFLTSKYETFNRTKKGAAIPHLDLNLFRALIFPLPPIEEQRRIVAKVDQLMALCDELEVKQKKRNEARISLNTSALDHLLAAKEPKEFDTHWQRISTNFDLLYDKPETVGKLRQAILQLAVQGKLVPQDPKDEPATVLLEKIKAEKEKLIEVKTIKPDKSLPEINATEIEYRLPDNWTWVRFQTITTLITCGIASTPTYVQKGKIFLSAGNVKPYRFMPENHKYVSEEAYRKITQGGKPELNDILLTRVGAGIGEATLIDQDIDFAYYVSLTLIKPVKEFLHPTYLLHWINSPLGVTKALRNTYGIGVSQGNLNVNQVRRFVLPLPPLDEQYRIVSKVDQLLELCDELETKLTHAEEASEELVEAVVREVIA